MYDTSINAGTSDYQRDKKSKIHDELVRWWYVRKGFHRGMRENFMDALDETYYEQLEHDITGYQGVNTGDVFKHLRSVWCSLDTGAIEDLKKDYYVEWDADLHITRFIKHLNDGQKTMERDGITISDADKLQHFIVQCYSSGLFDEKEMTAWENKIVGDKTWTNAKKYFSDIVESQDKYQKMSGRSTKRMKFESAKVAADVGDEMRGILEKLTLTNANQDQEAMYKLQQTSNNMTTFREQLQDQLKAKYEQIAALTAQVSGLNNSIQTLTQTISCHPVGNAGGGGGKPEAHKKKADTSLSAIAGRAVKALLD